MAFSVRSRCGCHALLRPLISEKRFEMKKIVTLVIGFLLVFTAIGFAQEPAGVSYEVLSGAQMASPVNWDTDIPVWKTGTIDAIDGKGVVINDIRYRWGKYGTRYRDLDNKTLSSSDFSRGTEVTLVLDTSRKSLLTLIKGHVPEPLDDKDSQD